MRRAWNKLGNVRPAQLLLETLVDSGWLDRLATQDEQGQATLADLMKMVRLVENAQQEAGFDMTRVAVALQAASESESEKPGVLSVEGLQAVRLMTVHGSKGLEFPIVAVTSCFTSRADSGALRTEAEGNTVYTSLMPKGAKLKMNPEFGEAIDFTQATSLADLRAMIEEEDARRAQAERRRLFYVAVTRATDALIVAMNKSRTNSMEYKEVEADLLHALFPGQDSFPETSGTFDYGGSQLGTLTRIEVRKDDEPKQPAIDDDTQVKALSQDGESTTAPTQDRGAGAEPPAGGTGTDPLSHTGIRDTGIAPLSHLSHTGTGPLSKDGETVLVPALEDPCRPELRPVPRRTGFFSYSAIAPHDAPAQARPHVASGPNGEDSIDDDNAAARVAMDADRATDFGSALHRTCEWLALHDGIVADDEALRTAWRFGDVYGIRDTNRLVNAVERWRNSAVAARAYAFASCQPEVPFYTQVAEDSSCADGAASDCDRGANNGVAQAALLAAKKSPAKGPSPHCPNAAGTQSDCPVLEGEIDLLCSDGDGHAFIVDYKTGGNDAETPDQLWEKHLLQARCYAYATLMSGYRSVELHFVRVERPDPSDPAQPQVVDYEFTFADLPELAAAITAAKQAAAVDC